MSEQPPEVQVTSSSNIHRGGGGGPMVADHWFRQIEKVLEAMDITFDATRIGLAAFQLEDES